jgi:hypothetical protein
MQKKQKKFTHKMAKRHIEEDLEIGGYMIPAGVCQAFLYYVNTTDFVT